MMEEIFSEAPDRWDRVKLKYLGDFVGGGTPSKSEKRYWNGDISWVSPKDMKVYEINDTIDHLTQEGLKEGSCKLIEPGALLMVYRSGILDHTLPVAINHVPVTLNQDMKAFIPDESLINAHYLTYLFRGHESRLLTLWGKEGTTVQSLESDAVENTKLPVPPFEEQREIVSYLRSKTDGVERLINVKEKLIDWLNEKHRALIARAVTQGLDEVPMQDTGYPWLGEVPAHWNVERLKFHLHNIEQGWSPSCYSYPAPEDKWGVLKVGAVNDWIFDPSENKQLPEDTEPRPELEIEEGDILMSRANTTELLGSVSIVQSTRDKLLLCDKLYRLDLKDGRFDPEFLVRFLRSDPGRFEFEQAATGTSGSMQNITQETVQNVWVVRPPLDEQRDIVESINERAEQINRVREGTQQTINLLKERRRSLITAAVTGQLDVGVPA